MVQNRMGEHPCRTPLLKQALTKRREGMDLPPDFTSRVMRQVHCEARRKSRQKAWVYGLSLVAAVVVLIGTGVYFICIANVRMPAFDFTVFSSPLTSFYGYIAFLVLLLLGLDYRLRKQKPI